jgi:hypothetical protein
VVGGVVAGGAVVGGSVAGGAVVGGSVAGGAVVGGVVGGGVVAGGLVTGTAGDAEPGRVDDDRTSAENRLRLERRTVVVVRRCRRVVVVVARWCRWPLDRGREATVVSPITQGDTETGVSERCDRRSVVVVRRADAVVGGADSIDASSGLATCTATANTMAAPTIPRPSRTRLRRDCMSHPQRASVMAPRGSLPGEVRFAPQPILAGTPPDDMLTVAEGIASPKRDR